jgi:hypothetical protein
VIFFAIETGRGAGVEPQGIGPTPEQRGQLGAAGIAAGLGCSVVVSLIVFVGGGVLLDRALETAPLLTLIGVAVGLAAAGYQLWELTRVGLKDRRPGPLGRGLARLPAGRPRTAPREHGEE